MAVQLQPTTPAQLDDIAALLCEAFDAPPDVDFVDRRLLQWKYFAAAEVWQRPCSYVLMQGESVAAHSAVAPLNLVIPHNQEDHAETNRVSGICFMDWVSGRQLPGAGLLLMKRLASENDFAIVAGGTDDTLSVVPKLGFTLHASLDTFARIIRPLRQWRTRPTTSLGKDAARVLRNTAWSLAPLGALDAEWTAKPVESFTEATTTSSLSLTMPEHGAELLNYWLRCPTTRVKGFEIQRHGERCGHFLLSYVAGQTRISDLRLRSDVRGDWEMAYRLATRTAAEDATTCEVVSLISTPFQRAALAACGFRQRGSSPLYLHDPRGKIAAAPPLCWSFIDDDTGYLYDPLHPYST